MGSPEAGLDDEGLAHVGEGREGVGRHGGRRGDLHVVELLARERRLAWKGRHAEGAVGTWGGGGVRTHARTHTHWQVN